MKKKLIVSIKSSSETLKSFKKAYRKVKNRETKDPHYEISFDTRKGFEKFVKNIHILSSIRSLKPHSVYELSKVTGLDVSNLNKIIVFFEDLGAIKIKKSKVNGREVKTPIVEYDEINFDLKSA